MPTVTKWITDRLSGLSFRLRAYRRLASGTYGNLHTFILFVGHPRSGHTLISTLLDAHPEVVLGNEVDVLKLVLERVPRRYVYGQMIDSAETFVRDGATWQGYSYTIPNQWQGRYSTLRVIGDKHAPATINKLSAEPSVLGKLQQMVGSEVGIRIIHTVRNPFDNIATIYKRQSKQMTLSQVTDAYFERCSAITQLKQQHPHLLDVRLEGMVGAPEETLAEMCRFAGVDCPPGYLRDCASIVFESPKKSRHTAEWPDTLVESIHQRIGQYDFLNGYSFDH